MVESSFSHFRKTWTVLVILSAVVATFILNVVICIFSSLISKFIGYSVWVPYLASQAAAMNAVIIVVAIGHLKRHSIWPLGENSIRISYEVLADVINPLFLTSAAAWASIESYNRLPKDPWQCPPPPWCSQLAQSCVPSARYCQYDLQGFYIIVGLAKAFQTLSFFHTCMRVTGMEMMPMAATSRADEAGDDPNYGAKSEDFDLRRIVSSISPPPQIELDR
jgi:hypothetical protein